MSELLILLLCHYFLYYVDYNLEILMYRAFIHSRIYFLNITMCCICSQFMDERTKIGLEVNSFVWETPRVPEHTKQTDSFSCGVFALKVPVNILIYKVFRIHQCNGILNCIYMNVFTHVIL